MAEYPTQERNRLIHKAVRSGVTAKAVSKLLAAGGWTAGLSRNRIGQIYHREEGRAYLDRPYAERLRDTLIRAACLEGSAKEIAAHFSLTLPQVRRIARSEADRERAGFIGTDRVRWTPEDVALETELHRDQWVGA